MSKGETIEKKSQPVRCYHCGRYVWENIKNGRSRMLKYKVQRLSCRGKEFRQKLIKTNQKIKGSLLLRGWKRKQ